MTMRLFVILIVVVIVVIAAGGWHEGQNCRKSKEARQCQ